MPDHTPEIAVELTAPLLTQPIKPIPTSMALASCGLVAVLGVAGLLIAPVEHDRAITLQAGQTVWVRGSTPLLLRLDNIGAEAERDIVIVTAMGFPEETASLRVGVETSLAGHQVALTSAEDPIAFAAASATLIIAGQSIFTARSCY